MSVTRNPCRYCVAAFHNKRTGHHIPNFTVECQVCENRKEYNRHLESKRKYTDGHPIVSLDELLEQEFVMMHGKPKHISFIQSMTLRTVLLFLRNGSLKRAERKENS